MVQGNLGCLAGDAIGTHVDKDQVVVGAAAGEAHPSSTKPVARAWALSRIRWQYAPKLGRSASPNATALAAMTCINGPPWIPGNTALSTFFANSSLQRIKPPRGPRKVLWVVVVTMSQ